MKIVLTHQVGGKRGVSESFDSCPADRSHKISLGREPSSDMVFDARETKVSAKHAEIHQEGRSFHIFDLQSTNGTYINGGKITASELHDGDLIELGLGGPRIKFELVPIDEAEEPPVEGAQKDANPPIAEKEPPPPPQLELKKAEPPAEEPKHKLGQTTVEFLINDAIRRSRKKQNAGWIVAGAAIIVLLAVLAIVLFRTNTSSSTFSEVAKHNQNAVVLIRCEYLVKDSNDMVLGEKSSDGTGFAVSSDGLIVTNRHVVRTWEYDSDLKERNLTGQLKRLLVLFADRKQSEALPADVYRLSQSPDVDLAVLRIQQFRDMPLVQKLNPNLGLLHQGDPVVLIGFPLGSQLLKMTGDQVARTTLTQGVVGRVADNFIQIDCRAEHGNSGGPVFNARGEVVAVITSGLVDSGVTGINFATPIRAAMELLNRE